MNRIDLYEGFGELDEEILERSEQARRKMCIRDRGCGISGFFLGVLSGILPPPLK